METLLGLYAEGRFHEAKATFERLELAGLGPAEQLEALHIGVKVYAALRLYPEAARTAERACVIRGSEVPMNLQARALFDRGAVAHLLGDWPVAIQSFSDYLALAERNPYAAPHCGEAHFNLGLARRARREFDQALEHYRRAVTLFAQGQNLPGLIRATHNCAWLLLVLKRRPEVTTYITAARSALYALSDVAESDVRFMHLLLQARIHLADGELLQAHRVLAEAGEEHPGATVSGLAQRCLVRAELALIEQDPRVALEQAEEALRLGQLAQDTIAVNEANRIRREAMTHSVPATDPKDAGGDDKSVVH